MQEGLIGPMFPLKGLTHASFGTVLIVFRNGNPVDAIRPDKRTLRGFRTKLIGDLDVAEINTGIVDLEFNLADMPTDDEFALKSLTIKARVSLDVGHPDDRGSLDPLKEHLRLYGPRFGEALLESARDALEAHVRELIASERHESLYRAPLSQLISPSRGDTHFLGIPLILVHGLSARNPVWSDHFLTVNREMAEIRAITSTGRVDVTRASVETQIVSTRATGQQQIRVIEATGDNEVLELQAQGRAKVELIESQSAIAALSTRLTGFEAIGRQYGISPMALANPEAHQLLTERAHESLMAMLDPAHHGALLRQPEIFQKLLEAAGLANLNNPQISYMHDTIDSPVVNIAKALGGGSDSDGMSVDRGLLKVWARAANGAPALSGLGWESTPDMGVVVAIGNPTPPPVLPEVVKALAVRMGVRQVVVVAISAGPYSQIVEDWFVNIAVTASLPTDGVTVRTKVDPQDGENDLTVLIGGAPQAARAVVSALTSPAEPYLTALENTLPFGRILLSFDDQ